MSNYLFDFHLNSSIPAKSNVSIEYSQSNLSNNSETRICASATSPRPSRKALKTAPRTANTFRRRGRQGQSRQRLNKRSSCSLWAPSSGPCEIRRPAPCYRIMYTDDSNGAKGMNCWWFVYKSEANRWNWTRRSYNGHLGGHSVYSSQARQIS